MLTRHSVTDTRQMPSLHGKQSINARSSTWLFWWTNSQGMLGAICLPCVAPLESFVNVLDDGVKDVLIQLGENADLELQTL